MKESPRRYTNPFLSDDEDEKVNFWNNQERQHSNIEDGLTNNCEDDEFENSLASFNVPSDFCEKETELYTDKNVMECELPELLVCYKEGTFHVKDICVDEGLPPGERILFDDNNDEILKPERYRFSPMEMEDYYMESSLCSGTNGQNDINFPTLEYTNDHTDIGDHQDKVSERKSDASDNQDKVIERKSDASDNQDKVIERKSDASENQDKVIERKSDASDNQDNVIERKSESSDNQDKVIERKSDASSRTQEVDADLPVTGSITDRGNISNISIDTDIPSQDLLNSESDKDYVDDAQEERGSEAEVIDSVVPNELKNSSKYESDNKDGTSECALDKVIFSPESDTASKATENYDPDINSSDNLLESASTKHEVSNSTPSLQEDRPLRSLKSLLESIDQQPCQSPIEEISKSTNILNGSLLEEGNNTSNLKNVKSEASHSFHKVDHPGQVHVHSLEPHGAPKLQDVASDNVAMAHPVHRGEGESSFSVAGPVSGLITYSGPIAFSGSISLRSDSSTTSTRSFAFPILPNEWNSSPVRMAKADRRRLQKHRGWRHGLLCCRF